MKKISHILLAAILGLASATPCITASEPQKKKKKKVSTTKPIKYTESATAAAGTSSSSSSAHRTTKPTPTPIATSAEQSAASSTTKRKKRVTTRRVAHDSGAAAAAVPAHKPEPVDDELRQELKDAIRAGNYQLSKALLESGVELTPDDARELRPMADAMLRQELKRAIAADDLKTAREFRNIGVRLTPDDIREFGLNRKTAKMVIELGLVQPAPSKPVAKKHHKEPKHSGKAFSTTFEEELIKAITDNQIEAAELLIQQGVRLSEKELAHLATNPQTANTLVMLKLIPLGTAEKSLFDKVFFGSLEQLNTLLSTNPKPYINAQKPPHGETPLMLAVTMGSAPKVQRILQENPNLHIKNTTGRTAIELANTHGTPPAIKQMIQDALKKEKK